MEILKAKTSNFICDVCNCYIIEGEEYVHQIASWQFHGKKEKYVGKAHKACDTWEANQ